MASKKRELTQKEIDAEDIKHQIKVLKQGIKTVRRVAQKMGKKKS